MSRTSFRIKRACALVAVVISACLIVAFILSDAWFGVMLALFVGVVGLQVVMQPDRMLPADVDEGSGEFADRWKQRGSED